MIEDDDRQLVVQSLHMLIEDGRRRPWGCAGQGLFSSVVIYQCIR